VVRRNVPSARAVSKYQAVERDIAVLVAEQITHAALMRAIWAAPTAGLLKDARLFDVYRAKPARDGSGTDVEAPEKSLAVRLTLHSDDATLTEAQIEAAVQAVVAQLGQDVGARQRV
jgi:phenylalanyl-tRNA synthetase beta chain